MCVSEREGGEEEGEIEVHAEKMMYVFSLLP